MIGHFDDPDGLRKWIADLNARKHNLAPGQRQAEMVDAIVARWNEIAADLPLYKRGGYLLDGPGPFNTLSLGNWITLAGAAGVPFVPIHYLGSLTMIDYLRHGGAPIAPSGLQLPDDLLSSPPGEAQPANLQDVDAAARRNVAAVNASLDALVGVWFVRTDGAASGRAKMKTYGGCDAATVGSESGFGYDTLPDGSRQIHLQDDRLGDMFMGWPEPDLPIWARPIVPARLIESKRGTFQAEWRIFISEGRIAAASSYYPQAPRDRDSEQDNMSLMVSLTYAQSMLDTMTGAGLRPHNPRYELREGFDKHQVHCSLDFIETADGGVMLLEGGPAHLRDPHYGAHPCAFSRYDAEDRLHPLPDMPKGIAWGGNVFSTDEELQERLAGVRGFLERSRAAPEQGMPDPG